MSVEPTRHGGTEIRTIRTTMVRLTFLLGKVSLVVPAYMGWALGLTVTSLFLVERVAWHGASALSPALPSTPRAISRLEQRLKEQNAAPIPAFGPVEPPIYATVDAWAPTVPVQSSRERNEANAALQIETTTSSDFARNEGAPTPVPAIPALGEAAGVSALIPFDQFNIVNSSPE